MNIEDLSRSAEKFSVTTKKVKRTYQMKNIKVIIYFKYISSILYKQFFLL